MSQKLLNRFLIIVIMVVSVCIGSIVHINNNEEVTSEEIEVELPEVMMPDVSAGFGDYDNAVDCYLAAIAMLEKETNFEKISTGKISAKAGFISFNQEFRTTLEVDGTGDIIYEEITVAQSSLTESSAVKTWYDKDNGAFEVVETNKIDSNFVPTYANKTEKYDKESYLNKYYYLPLQELFIVSDATLKTESFEKSDDKYKISLDLTTNSVIAGYKAKVKKNSTSSSLPKFSEIVINAEITKDGYIKTMTITEKFSVRVLGVTAEVTSVSEIEYEYNKG